MSTEKKESQQELDLAIKRIRELELAIAQKEAENQEEKQEQGKQLEKLQRELVAIKYDREQAQERIISLESQRTSEEEELLQTTVKVKTLEEEIEGKQSGPMDAATVQQVQKMAKELAKLKREREEAQLRAKQLEQERNESRLEVKSASAKMAELETNIKEVKSGEDVEKQEHLVELRRLEAELEESRRNSEAAQDHIKELEEERNRNYQELARSGKQIDGLVTEISNRETEMHLREEQQSQELARLKKALKGTLDKSQEAQDRLARLQAEQAETNQQLAEAGLNVANLASKLDEIKETQKQREEEQRNAITPEEKARLQDELDNLRLSLEDKQKALLSAESEKSNLEQVAKDKKGNLDKLKNALEEAQREAEAAEAKRREVEREKQAVEGALEQMRETAEVLHQRERELYDEKETNYGAIIAVVLAILIGAGYFYFVGMAPDEPVEPIVIEEPVDEAPVVAQTETPAEPAAPKLSVPEDGVMTGEKLVDKMANGQNAPQMVKIKGAVFTMGNNRIATARDARPEHDVAVKSFAVGAHEVTFQQYDVFAKSSGRKLPSDHGWGRDDRPVINVSWDDALAYTQWLSKQTGKSYRLLSEAEWEYMARAGGSKKIWWGNVVGKNKANCFDCGSQWDRSATSPVGSFESNAFGVFNTAGNVQEWVADCYHKNYKEAPNDGSVWESAQCKKRVVRGGAYNRPSSSMLSIKRSSLEPTTKIGFVGFRVARDL